MEDLTKFTIPQLSERRSISSSLYHLFNRAKNHTEAKKHADEAMAAYAELERRQAELDSLRAAHPIRWASITPTGPCDDGKRAPRDGDKHNCGMMSQYELVFWKREEQIIHCWFPKNGGVATYFCYKCGGLLPTADTHEGMDKNSHFAAIKRHADRRDGNAPFRVESEPDDHQAQLLAINSAISAALRDVAHLIGGDHDTDHPADKVGQLRDLALRLEKALAAAMGESANLDWCVRRLRDALRPFADIASDVPSTANSESKFRASVYVRSLRYARDSYELSLKKAPNSSGENESKYKPLPGTLDSDVRSLKQANRDLRHQNYLVKKDADKVKERMAAVERSRDTYARTAQELGAKLDAAHQEIERMKSGGSPAIELEDALAEAQIRIGEGNARIRVLECDVERLKAEIKVDYSFLEHHKELLDSIPECPVHGSCIPWAIEWVEKQKARINESESQKHEKDSFRVFTDPAMPSADKQAWTMYKMEDGVWKIVDDGVAEPCATCFHHQNGQCHHPKTSSYEPAECRTRPSDACGPAGKLWAEKKAKEAPKCQDCKWCDIGRNFCLQGDTLIRLASPDFERNHPNGRCGPLGKLFTPKEK